MLFLNTERVTTTHKDGLFIWSLLLLNYLKDSIVQIDNSLNSLNER